MKENNLIPQDLLETQRLLYIPHELILENFKNESESQEYSACTFSLNSLSVAFRIAKITPTKIGQFVTLWKRINNGPIMPFDACDAIDLWVVNVKTKHHFGQFAFPKKILIEKGILSKNNIGGKRAMRVYPPWDITDNSQAKRSQQWQLLYFCEIPCNDIIRIKKLFSHLEQ